MIEEVTKNFLNDALECLWCVLETKRHDEPLEMAVVSDECCFADIIRIDRYMPVAASIVQRGEVFGRMKLIKDVLYTWN